MKEGLFVVQSTQHPYGHALRLISARPNACSCMAPPPCAGSACRMASMGRALRAALKPCSAPMQIADFGMSRVLAHNKSHVSTDTHGTPHICHQIDIKTAARCRSAC